MQNSIPPIYEYQNLHQYFDAVGRSLGRRKDRPYSQAQWAKRLQYRSRRTFGMVLARRRKPSQSILERFGRVFALTNREKEYLRLLAELERVADGDPDQLKRLRLLSDLEMLRPTSGPRKLLQEAELTHLSRWYHVVIKQLIQGGKVAAEETAIAKALGGRVSIPEVRRSLEKMLMLGILKPKPEGGYEVAVESIATIDDLPSGAVRQHHREQASRAVEALFEEDVTEREFCTLTFRFDRANLREAKESIRNFVDEFDRNFGEKVSADVYQLNLQLFSQTKRG